MPERMLKKMKDTGKSGLTIKSLILIFIVIMILSIFIQMFTNTKNEIQVADFNTNIQEEIQIANNYERELEVTTRSGLERNITEEIEVEEEKYISIEEITISKGMDLTIRCGISKEDFKELMRTLRADTSGFFYENSDIIYDLCEKYELNEIFFCGLIAAESGWNISSNHRNKCNYISMMSKGKLIRYSSEEEGLEAAAKLLHNNYLTEGGSCYYGKTLSSIQRRFCPNSSTWVGLVYGCMNQIV